MTEEKSKAIYAEFYRKPADEKELTDSLVPGEKWKVQIEKIVELSQDEFISFVDELYGYYRFIYDNGGYMYFDEEENCAHCLLVRTPERKEGILVESEGFSYVRYGAYVPDCNALDLSGIPVESHVPRLLGPEPKKPAQDSHTKKNGKSKNHVRERGER